MSKRTLDTDKFESSRDRLALESLVGLSVGDALGARFEGRRALDLSRLDIPLEPREGNVARWTDDTQMAVSIVEILRAGGTIEPDRLAAAFGRRFEPWRGYGAGMHVLLPELRAGKNWREINKAIFPGGSFGNGSAMRVAPLGAYFHDAPMETAVQEAERSAEVTHAHPEALAGAAATAVAAWSAARSRGRAVPPSPELFSAVLASLDPARTVTQSVEAADELGSGVDLTEAVARLGNGSNVTCADTVPLALWIAFRHLADYETAVRSALAAGGDTDTLAAIVGGIVAARVGVEGIPRKWREGVEALPTGGRR